eukprot:8122905-Alexandrium_andersonii.AAC.1
MHGRSSRGVDAPALRGAGGGRKDGRRARTGGGRGAATEPQAVGATEAPGDPGAWGGPVSADTS